MAQALVGKNERYGYLRLWAGGNGGILSVERADIVVGRARRECECSQTDG